MSVDAMGRNVAGGLSQVKAKHFGIALVAVIAMIVVVGLVSEDRRAGGLRSPEDLDMLVEDRLVYAQSERAVGSAMEEAIQAPQLSTTTSPPGNASDASETNFTETEIYHTYQSLLAPPPQTEGSGAPHKNFLIFFSGHQGSSWLADMLGSMPDVFVPGFEPLEVENATAEQKMAFLRKTFELPEPSEEAYKTWIQDLVALSDEAGFRLGYQDLPTYDKIRQTRASGFKVRPYKGKRTGFRGLNLHEVKRVLDDYNVSIILTTRHNTLKSAVSWYRAREEGLNQFHLTHSADFDKNQRITFNLTTFSKWLDFVEQSDRELRDSISFFQRPTITVGYEELRLDPITMMKEVARFLRIDDKQIAMSGRFRKTGSDSLRKMILNFQDFCKHFWQSPYQSMLEVESCSLPEDSEGLGGDIAPAGALAAGAHSAGSDFAHLVTSPNGTNAKDCFSSGWAQTSDCVDLLRRSKLESVLRARRRQVPIFFKHIHKAGGTTLCAVASANVFTEWRSLPNVQNWGTDCVPYEAFLSRPSPSFLSNSLMKLSSVDADKLVSHSGWLGGACFFGHLSVSAQHALPRAFPNLGFVASEGPLPDDLALNLDYPMVTMMRDPFDRIVSAHKWWRFMAQRFPGAGAAASICSAYVAPANATLSEWIDYYPDNWVTRSLLGAHYLYNFKTPLTLMDLERAKNRVDAFSAVLILEEYDLSMRVVRALFEWSEKTGASEVAANVSPAGRSDGLRDLDDLTRQKVGSRIQLDLLLYQYAHRVFLRHANQLGLGGGGGGASAAAVESPEQEGTHKVDYATG